jgi:signal transduction histidine kinase
VCVVFSAPHERQRSDLLEVVSVLDREGVLERTATIGRERTGARIAVMAVLEGDGNMVLRTQGTTSEAGRALRERLRDSGLRRGAAGADPDVLRLTDPETGGEVLRVPVVVSGRLYADLLLVEPHTGSFDSDDVESISVLGRVAGVAVRNALNFAASERRRDAAEATSCVDEVLRHSLPPHAAAPLVAEGAARITRADLAAVVSLDSDGLEVSALLGDRATLTATVEVVRDAVLLAQDGGESLEEFDDQGRVVVVLPIGSRLAGGGAVVLLLHPDRARYGMEDRELLASYVDHVSLVLDRLALQDQERRAVLVADRDRIARDLHDVVIQRLLATGLRLRAVLRGAPGGEQLVTDAVKDLEGAVRDIRTTIFELERGTERSLRADVLALGHEYEGVLGFRPRVQMWGPLDSLVGKDLAQQTTVVLREALSNCARHAHASRCDIDLEVAGGWLRLVVVDDGHGPDEDAGAPSGLRNLAARAAGRGGRLVLERGEPSGARLVWEVPLPGQEGDSASLGESADAGEGQTSGAARDISVQHTPTATR